jgi:uncharacterized protein YutE (UPF0331/DUF86 family)
MEPVPTGREWHRDLLIQMSAEVTTIRPSVITRSSRNCLDDYRGLRYVIRNVYTFNLESDRLQELVQNLPGCYESVVQDLTKFCNFLEELEEA